MAIRVVIEEHKPPSSMRTVKIIVEEPKPPLRTRAIRWWQTLDPPYRRLILGLGAIILLIGVIVIVWKIPQRQLAPLKPKIQRERNNLQPHDRLKLEHDARKLENDARTTLVQAVGGLALLLGLYFTAKTLQTTQEGQITNRFTKAINQLGEAGPEKLAIRLGGIYALERIVRESKRDYWPIMEILTAYVREHAPWPPSVSMPAEQTDQEQKSAADIQAILTVLGRRSPAFGTREDEHLNLWEVDLRNAYLPLAHLEGVDFTEAHLEKASLTSAHLHGTTLLRAHLEGAILAGADMREAFLMEAHLEGADLTTARLEGAILAWAHLERATLWRALLEKAMFLNAHLEEAIFAFAHLEGARELTVEQLSTVKTLYQAHLDPPLLDQIQQRYPHLLEESSLPWP